MQTFLCSDSDSDSNTDMLGLILFYTIDDFIYCTIIYGIPPMQKDSVAAPTPISRSMPSSNA